MIHLRIIGESFNRIASDDTAAKGMKANITYKARKVKHIFTSLQKFTGNEMHYHIIAQSGSATGATREIEKAYFCIPHTFAEWKHECTKYIDN